MKNNIIIICKISYENHEMIMIIILRVISDLHESTICWGYVYLYLNCSATLWPLTVHLYFIQWSHYYIFLNKYPRSKWLPLLNKIYIVKIVIIIK